MKKRSFAISFLLIAILAVGVYTGSASDKEPPEKCANCHSDSLVFKQWEKSDHAISLKILLKDPTAGDTCLRCHSSDYRSIVDNPWVSRKELIKIENATNAVSCSSCHRHDSGFEKNLIMPADKLCVSCHVHFCGG